MTCESGSPPFSGLAEAVRMSIGRGVVATGRERQQRGVESKFDICGIWEEFGIRWLYVCLKRIIRSLELKEIYLFFI